MSRSESSPFRTDDRRWRALEGRDAGADGSFVYAVRTTGVYCRPNCRSRLPNRENVAFFDDVEGAERAGFRACKRCKPGSRPAEVDRVRAIARACSLIEGSDAPPSLAELAAEAGLSPGYFHRLFKKTLGVTPKEFAMSLRTQRLRDGLAGGETVAGAILGAGFGSIARAYEGAAGDLGMTPGEYRKGGEGRSIRFATAESSLGWVLVAETDRGLCAIQMGDSREGLVAGLVGRFPKAELSGDDPDFADRVRRVVALVEAPGGSLDLPLDVRGTAFQRQVWDALRAIPAGSTATYTEVARMIGRPSAVRAVAGACASNELAVVIPCHRVIRGDGGLGGYRWGIERKRALLEGEAEER
jgi:AraC family transcriptional regulator of adaptative response/methylated-DNA-[protein]-cysteine methyltransferase